jgi:hypothetical protein
MKILIGSTGLVGTTLKESIKFDYEFNSKNINDFLNHDYVDAELYLSCLPATKWMVNKNIPEDLKNIDRIIDVISKKSYKKVILISTIDVYCDSPLMLDESYPIGVKKLSYGTNRYFFEMLVENLVDFEELKIFRLPALYNKHIKKNILYDLINNNNIEQINTNSSFQWYNLDNLSTDIESYSNAHPKRKLFNLFTEPLDTKEIVKLFPQYENIGTFSELRNEYNFKTNLTEEGYILSKEEVLEDIKRFIHEISSK